MSLSNGKHIVKELNGIRCTIIEEKVSKERVDFLSALLTFNKFEVVIEEQIAKAEEGAEKPQETTYSIGVTDLVFNPVIAVYSKKLYTKTGKIVTPNIWYEIEKDKNLPYWVQNSECKPIYEEELLTKK